MTATNLHPQLIDSYEMEGYINRPLSDGEIGKMLKSHSADTTDVASTSGWTLFDMLAFLGY